MIKKTVIIGGLTLKLIGVIVNQSLGDDLSEVVQQEERYIQFTKAENLTLAQKISSIKPGPEIDVVQIGAFIDPDNALAVYEFFKESASSYGLKYDYHSSIEPYKEDEEIFYRIRFNLTPKDAEEFIQQIKNNPKLHRKFREEFGHELVVWKTKYKEPEKDWEHKHVPIELDRIDPKYNLHAEFEGILHVYSKLPYEIIDLGRHVVIRAINYSKPGTWKIWDKKQPKGKKEEITFDKFPPVAISYDPGDITPHFCLNGEWYILIRQ